MPYTARQRGPSRWRRGSSTDPIRIVIDKRPTNWTDAYSCVWFISPVERDIRSDDPSDEFASYQLEIRLGGHLDGGQQIKRLAYQHGDEWKVLGNVEFEELVQEAVEHGEDEDEYRDQLSRDNIWPEDAMRTFGFDLTYFDRMEAAWSAARQLFDFAHTR